MKIGLVTQYCPPEFEGGVECVVRAQTRELVRLGHEVLVVSGMAKPHEGHDVLPGELEGAPVRRLPRQEDEGYDVELVRPRLSRLVARELQGCDVVHLHHWSTLSSDLVRRLSASAPVVAFLHDLFVSCPRFFRLTPTAAVACPPPGTFEACVRCIETETGTTSEDDRQRSPLERHRGYRAELAAAAALLAPSRSHAQRLANLMDVEPSRFRVVPYGQCRPLRPLPPSHPPWQGERPLRVLHCGNLCWEKGTLDLVDALASLAGRVTLVLAGAPLEPSLLLRITARAGRLEVELHGAYDDRELPRLARECDVAAFPSRAKESYGSVLDEVIALGLPALVADRGALKERFPECTRVLPAENVTAWTGAFERLLEAPSELAALRAHLPRRLRTAAGGSWREREATAEGGSRTRGRPKGIRV